MIPCNKSGRVRNKITISVFPVHTQGGRALQFLKIVHKLAILIPRNKNEGICNKSYDPSGQNRFTLQRYQKNTPEKHLPQSENNPRENLNNKYNYVNLKKWKT